MLKLAAQKRIDWLVAICGFMVTIAVSPGSTLDPINIPKLWVMSAFTFGLLGVIATQASQIFRKVNLKVIAPVGILLGAMLLAMFFSDSSFTKQIFGDYGRNTGLLAYFCFGVLFLSIALGSSNISKKSLTYGFCAALAVNVLYGLIQAIGKDPQKWNNPYNKVIGTLGNPNFASSLLGMGIAFASAHLLSKKIEIKYRLFSGIYIAIALFDIQNSDAQQGLLVAILGIGICLFFEIRSRFKNRYLNFSYLLVAFSGSLLIVFGMLQKGPLRELIYKDSVTFRGDYWHAGIKMFQTHPIFGIGLDSFGDWYRFTRTVEATLRRGPSVVTNAAHNVFIDIAATAGILALLAYVAVIFLGLRAAYQIIKRSESVDPFLVGLLAAWIGYLAQSVISINNLALGIWGWIFPGAIIAFDRWQTEDKILKKETSVTDFTGMTMTIGLVLGAVIGFMPFNSDANYRHAVESSDAKMIVVAAQKWPTNSNRLNTATLIMHQNNLSDFEYQLAKESLKFNPRSFDAWFNLYSATKATDAEKTKALEQMIFLDPHNTDLKKIG